MWLSTELLDNIIMVVISKADFGNSIDWYFNIISLIEKLVINYKNTGTNLPSRNTWNIVAETGYF